MCTTGVLLVVKELGFLNVRSVGGSPHGTVCTMYHVTKSSTLSLTLTLELTDSDCDCNTGGAVGTRELRTGRRRQECDEDEKCAWIDCGRICF